MYLHVFKNQYRDHDFTLISDVIKEYFPVDKPKRLTSKTVASSPGFKKVSKLVNSEYLDENAYRDKWEKLTSHLESVFKKPVHGHPDLMGGGSGGFSGSVVLTEDNQPDFIRRKCLQFYISIIGPFFSIQGIDSSTALLPMESRFREINNGKGYYAATHAVTISPEFEYQDTFNTLENELRAYFPGYRFVPYQVGMSTIKNISIADELRDLRSMDTIYEAIFGRAAVHECAMRGDTRYGMNDWFKPFNTKEQLLIDSISQHMIDSPSDITVHKVWELQESKRLETFKVSGNLMFGMDLFDVIDLTDESKVIMVSQKSGTPGSAKYKIKNNVIEFTPYYSFRIADLSKEALTLHLILNIENKNVSIKGEALEMKFVVMT
jgi:hypothetical protein